MKHIKALVVYVGGTIGMIKKDGYLQVKKNYLPNIIYTCKRLNHARNSEDPFYESKDSRLYYTINEVENIKDSSDLGIEDWINLVNIIRNNYNSYDAFICLHGTDTMAYTSSALSFLIENLNKPIVFTGASSYFNHSQSDAVDNVEGVFQSILRPKLKPNVYMFFNKTLLIGNRSTKFISAKISTYSMKNPTLFEPKGEVKFYDKLNENIALRKLFPGIQSSQLRGDLEKCDGIIIESFGCGNVPMNLVKIIIEEAKNTVIVNISQCMQGFATSHYQSGYLLSKAQAIVCGRDMTTEAAYAKLSFLLANYKIEDVKILLKTNMRGEMSESLSFS